MERRRGQAVSRRSMPYGRRPSNLYAHAVVLRKEHWGVSKAER